MVKIQISDAALEKACYEHFRAICFYVKRKRKKYQKELFEAISRLMPYDKDFEQSIISDDWRWLKNFLLSDVETLRNFTKKKDLLQFKQFRDLYLNRFCAGADRYIDETLQYNAYTFLRNLGTSVCPYCDEEYIEILKTEDEKMLRTTEIDHFFPKSDYPALALCFYNLIPSGQNCNGIKRNNLLGMNPYEENIEQCTYLYPNLPVGVNMENVDVNDCEIYFHPKQGMQENVKTLCLEQRYKKYKDQVHRYLKIKQQYDENKVREMVKAGFFPSVEMAYRVLYGEPLQENGKPQLLGKLKHDLVGR